jgi:hypothetical protein
MKLTSYFKHFYGIKSFTFFGGLFGLLSFIVVGLLPSLVYGGYAGVVLANGIFGSAADPTFLMKIIVIMGVVTGVLSTAGLFTVCGAAGGAGIYTLANKVTSPITKNVKGTSKV